MSPNPAFMVARPSETLKEHESIRHNAMNMSLHKILTVESATQACALTDGIAADRLGTLAAAYAETGDFDAAVKWQVKVVRMSTDERDPEEASARLAPYQAKKPYRQNPRAE